MNTDTGPRLILVRIIETVAPVGLPSHCYNVIVRRSHWIESHSSVVDRCARHLHSIGLQVRMLQCRLTAAFVIVHRLEDPAHDPIGSIETHVDLLDSICGNVQDRDRIARGVPQNAASSAGRTRPAPGDFGESSQRSPARQETDHSGHRNAAREDVDDLSPVLDPIAGRLGPARSCRRDSRICEVQTVSLAYGVTQNGKRH